MSLIIFEQLYPATPLPFRIVEKIPTIDGPRDRISHRSYATLSEAKAFCLGVEFPEKSQ